MTDLTVALRLTADASGLKAEVAQAGAALGGLGPAAAGGAAGAAAPLRQTEEAARRAGAGLKETADGARAAAEATRITAREMQQLAPQLTDLAVQVASGGGIFLPLLQQGAQITPIFGGMRGTLAAVVGTIGAVPLAVGAAAVAIGGLVAVGEASERSFNALQNRLRATRDDYEALAATVRSAANAFSSSSQFGSGESRDAGAILAGSGRFGGSASDLQALLRTAGDLSVVLGRTLPDAAGLLAKAMQDPAAVARDLAASDFRGFNPAVARQIELLQLSQGKAAAYAEVLRRVSEATEGAANNRTNLEKALTDLGNAFDRLWEKAKPVAEVLARIAGTAIGGIASVLPGAEPSAPGGGSAGAGGAAAGGGTSARVDDALATALRLNPRLARQQTNSATAAGLRAALADADPGQRRVIEDALRQLGAEAYGLRGPAAEQFQALDDQAAVARRMPGADQTIFAAQLQFRRTMERDGGGASQAQLGEVAARVQRRLTEEAITYTDQLQLQAEGLDRVAAASLQGSRAASDMEIQVRAEAEARKYSTVTGAEHEQQVALLRNAYLTLRDAQQAVRDSQAQFDQQQQIELLEAETAAVGGNVRERQRELAVLRERQRILREGGDPNSAAGQARLTNAGILADRGQDLAERRATFDQLASFGERAWDRIGTAATLASLQGQQGLRNLANVGRAVVSELVNEFAKLAVINPIKNAIFGTAAPTFASVASLFFGGGGGSVASVAPVTPGLNLGGNFVAGTYQGIGQHEGGIMGADATFVREVPRALYSGAQRFHSGLAPDEFPAILQKGEGVFTPAQMAALGPAGGQYTFAPTVNFSGNAGSAEDRAALLEQMRALWLQDLASAAPAIAGAAREGLITDVRRRGMDRVFR